MTGRYIFPNTIRFILVLLLQVFVLNNINLFGWASPMVYPFLILLLPINLPVSIVLLSAFFAGYTVDFNGFFAQTITYAANAAIGI